MQWQLVPVFFLATFVSVSALSCVACQPDHQCPVLPDDKKCYPARKPCSCCDACAGLRGDACGSFKIRCHPDLVCVNAEGEEKETVKWYEDFEGVCKVSKADRAEKACRRLDNMLTLVNSSNSWIPRILRRFLNRLYKKCVDKHSAK